MKASVKWLNRLLQPGDLSTDDAEHILTFAGFPIDGREDLPGGDARLEVEITSNRGDCLCHVGLAREIAAASGRRAVLPAVPHPPAGDAVRAHLALENRVREECPRFTARVIRGVRVGPSPAWLVEALESVGQRSINNIVDVTNFVNFEFGQPSHVFDLSRLAGGRLVVRYAREGEALTTLDGNRRTLHADEVVVADADRAQSIAGVIGGADSEVSTGTTDIVLEAATWNPTAVRRAARRHAVRTDASHRFERIVDPRAIDLPGARAAALIVEVAGGRIEAGVLDEGAPPKPPHEITLRPERCRLLMGVEIAEAEMSGILRALSVEVRHSWGDGGVLACRIPSWRPDLEREVDLIEEVARIKGFDHVPIAERISITVRTPQPDERAMRELGTVLTGLGFYETVTFSFLSRDQARPFLPPGLELLEVDDERRKGEPALRPGILPSLLACRRANQDAGADVPGGIRLYETGSTFAREAGSARTVETLRLGLLMDIPDVPRGRSGGIEERQAGVRMLRGALEALVRALGGPGSGLELVPGGPAAFDADARGSVLLNGRAVGALGIADASVQRAFDLDVPVAGAEVDLAPLIAEFPGRALVHTLPAFPGIERDVSLIVPERTSWAIIGALVRSAELARLEGVAFVGAYRGRQIGAGRKSVTLRLSFRDPSRTLRREEVDPQVGSLVALAGRELGAELRA